VVDFLVEWQSADYIEEVYSGLKRRHFSGNVEEHLSYVGNYFQKFIGVVASLLALAK
jgi:hypothetical protein